MFDKFWNKAKNDKELFSLINAGSLWTETHWSCSTITLSLHIGVGSLGCELSIFFLKKNQIFLILFIVQPKIKTYIVRKNW